MAGEVDLHIHSDHSSDGSYSPQRLVELAKKHKLRAISIADHDTISAYPEALERGEAAGVEVIPSLEVTTLFDGREFHLLLPFVEWKSPGVARLVAKISDRRFREAGERVHKLQNLGFEITLEEVMDESGPFPPLGVSIALTLLKKYRKRKHPALKKYFRKDRLSRAPYLFYKDYFMEGKPASVPRYNLGLLEVLEGVPKTKGVPVIAHPGAYFQKVTGDDLHVLKERGLEGLEVYTSYHDAGQTRSYLAYAKELDLVPTAGSDFHGAIKPHIPFAYLNKGGYWMVEELAKRRS